MDNFTSDASLSCPACVGSGHADDARDLIEFLLKIGPSHQGGHSDTGQFIARYLEIPFPLSMDSLSARALELNFKTEELWPWYGKRPSFI